MTKISSSTPSPKPPWDQSGDAPPKQRKTDPRHRLPMDRYVSSQAKGAPKQDPSLVDEHLAQAKATLDDLRKPISLPTKVAGQLQLTDSAFLSIRTATHDAQVLETVGSVGRDHSLRLFGGATKPFLGKLDLVTGGTQLLLGAYSLIVDETPDGRPDGLGNIAAGALTATAGLSQFTPWIGNASTKVLTGMGLAGRTFAAGTALGGLANMVNGGMELYSGLKNGDPQKTMLGGAKALGGTLVTAGTVLDLTGAGAVIGLPMQAVGSALLLGTLVYEVGSRLHRPASHPGIPAPLAIHKN